MAKKRDREKLVLITTKLTPEMHRLLRLRAADEGRRIYQVAGDILRTALVGEGK